MFFSFFWGNNLNFTSIKMKKLLILSLVSGLIFTSCSDDDSDSPATGNLTLNLSGLEDLGSGFLYEGWVIVDGSPVSTGTFSVSTDGTLSATSFAVDATSLENSTAFVLSIEPSPDDDAAPAATKVLQGEFSGTSATVSTGIVGDFSSAAGSFFLRTPTDEAGSGVNNGNDENGVWFGIPGMPPTESLDLPTLPEGWAYEGWVVGETGPITTGTFTAFDVADDSAPFSGEASGPPVPGEDFFSNAPDGETFPLDIRGRTVVISVEPVPDNSAAPFAMKPLVGTSGDETAPTTHDLALNLSSLPSGTVTR